MLSFGSRFRVQVAASPSFFRRWYSRIAAFPSRGRCPVGADRALAVRKRAGRSISSRRFMKVPYPPLRGPPSPCGEGLGGATLRIDFYKGRCPKVVSSHQPLETTHPCFQTTGFKGFRWRLRRLFLEDGILVSQPSPLGEGARKGRIG